MTQIASREAAAALDAADPLRSSRDQFILPEGVIYLDGNSLGALPKGVGRRVAETLEQEWGEDLIRSWNSHDWFTYPQRVGARLAPLIGAEADEVVATDTTSVNVFKMTAAAMKMRPDRRMILTQRDNFPTDIYVTEGLIDMLGGGYELRLVGNDQIMEALDESVAVVSLTQVDYRSGEKLDMRAITEKAHAVGALIIWDLCHSAGALPVDLNGCEADFAVGCGYKYLNGGPGAPAFLFVAKRHHGTAEQPLSGWWAHQAPFEFSNRFAGAAGIERQLCGTQPILSMAALEAALTVFEGVDMEMLRSKSLDLTDLFIALVEDSCGEFGFQLITPREHDRRGSQASFRHPDGFAIMQALIARGVIGDFRAPDILRFGFAPLYNGFADIWDAVGHLQEIMQSGEWRDEKYSRRGAVT